MAVAFFYELMDPIETKDDVITSVTVRKPTLDDTDVMRERLKAQSELKAFKHMLHRLTGIAEPLIGQLTMPDLAEIQERLDPFFGKPPKAAPESEQTES